MDDTGATRIVLRAKVLTTHIAKHFEFRTVRRRANVELLSTESQPNIRTSGKHHTYGAVENDSTIPAFHFHKLAVFCFDLLPAFNHAFNAHTATYRYVPRSVGNFLLYLQDHAPTMEHELSRLGIPPPSSSPSCLR